ncbi:aspartate--tRNA(Asn) ligase [Candidatus Pacearchaeota archaeon]|nr:aspartate--tRNA(Asn) ligase [Candidatus Pacearchaeota archaeon]
MERIYLSHLSKHVGMSVLVKGFIHEIRDQKSVKFIMLRDVTGIAQLVVTPDQKNLFSSIVKVPRESVLSVTGTVVAQKSAPGGIELQVTSYEVLSEALPQLPIPVVEKSDVAALPKRLDHRWIDLRKPRNLFIFKLWTFMEQAMREWWAKEGFIQVYTPKFMSAPSESGAELFSVEYFGKKAYLAQSPQFFKQMAMASGFEKIFEIGPVFRANKSHTVRHDTEFTMIDMEVSFIESHEEVMHIEERWIHYFLSRITETYGKEIKELFGQEVVIPSLPFPRMTMAEVQKTLRKQGWNGPEDDLDAEGEKLLAEFVQKKFHHEFIFVTDYPISARPFYHMRQGKKGELTKSFDLIWKGTEVTTGAQREHRYDILASQADEKGIKRASIKEYLSFFQYGCPPHGGFAISPTRFLMLMLDVKNVREVTFLPRDTDRLTP